MRWSNLVVKRSMRVHYRFRNRCSRYDTGNAFHESVRCGQGPLRLSADGERSLPPPQGKLRCQKTWQTRDIVKGLHGGMFRGFAIAPVKWLNKKESIPVSRNRQPTVED